MFETIPDARYQIDTIKTGPLDSCPADWREQSGDNGVEMVAGSAEPLVLQEINEENFASPMEASKKLFDGIDGVEIIGSTTDENGADLPVVSFKYHKIKYDKNGENGKIEQLNRVIVLTGISYGVHSAHAGQQSAHYLVGAQIGTMDPVTKQVVLANRESSEAAVPVNNYSLDCIYGGTLGTNPVLANGSSESLNGDESDKRSNYRVEALTDADLDAIEAILVERLDVLKPDMNGLGTTRSVHVMERIKESLGENSFELGKYFVLKDDQGEVLGVTGLRNVPDEAMQSFVETDKALEIINVYISEEKARRGLGGTIIENVIDWARENGYEELVLNSGPRNKLRSWPFWDKHFARRGVCRDYYGPGGDAPVWGINLSQRLRPNSI